MPSFLVKAECTEETQQRLMDKLQHYLDPMQIDGSQHFYCTLILAKTWTKEPRLTQYPVKYTYLVKDIALFGYAIVLILDTGSTSFIAQRHYQLKEEMQATTYYSTYIPHVTIGYSTCYPNLETLKKEFVGMSISLDYESGISTE